MVGRDEIRLECSVVNGISETACRVELANGHQMVAHTTRRNKVNLARVEPGDKLVLLASPFDFSKGRVINEKETK